MTNKEKGLKLLEKNPRYDITLSELTEYLERFEAAECDELFYTIKEVYAYGIARGYNLGTRKNEKG